MKTVLQIVRKTSLYFQPQIRTKIMNEGWASYWHETLFMRDDRIAGHEVDFARVNAAVTAMPRVGLNPYALGMRLFYFIEEAADKGRYSQRFLALLDAEQRRKFDQGTGTGQDYIFQVRENLNDFLFVNTFIEQDFVDRHKLFVADKVLDEQRMVWQWYVKSRKADDYKQMVKDSALPPAPHHRRPGQDRRGRPVPGPPLRGQAPGQGVHPQHHAGPGVPVGRQGHAGDHRGQDRSRNPISSPPCRAWARPAGDEDSEPEIEWQRVRYTMKDRKLSKGLI